MTVIVRTTLAELNQAAHAVHNPDIADAGPGAYRRKHRAADA